MKKYRVTVNGTVYEVELEELTGSAPVSAPAAPAAAPGGSRRCPRTCRACRTRCR